MGGTLLAWDPENSARPAASDAYLRKMWRLISESPVHFCASV